MAFHVIGSLYGCRESKEKGLMNLQTVLSEKTILEKLLERAGVIFDIQKSSCAEMKIVKTLIMKS